MIAIRTARQTPEVMKNVRKGEQVNYYNHHIGDYITKTIHLSLEQHGAYRRMMDIYYSTEKPLPLDIDLICRKIPTHTESERAAVIYILSQPEFFEKRDDGYHNEHCDAVIRMWKRNRNNGKLGGRPLKKEHGEENPKETQKKPKQEPKAKPNAKPRNNPPNTQYPIPNTQEENKDTVLSDDNTSSSSPEEGACPSGFLLSKRPSVPYEEIRRAFNEICTAYPACRAMSDRRKKMVNVTWRHLGGTMDAIRTLFKKAQESDFLKGLAPSTERKDNPFVASFDFIINPNKAIRIMEGLYDNNKATKGISKNGSDFAEKMKELTANKDEESEK